MQRLPEDVKSMIRTGVALPSVTQVTEELLLNSIDAGASNIAVRVDLSCFKIQVVDNGHGITEDHFELIGERYATSKCHSVKDLETLKHYGFRGEALASIRHTSSFLEIISRAKGSSITLSKCFHRGKQSLVSKVSTSRPSVGTTITIHDLFYNLPVRQMKSNVALEIERLKQRVAGLALMWPQITISLRNDSSGQILLQTRKCSSALGVFHHLFAVGKPNDVMEMSAQKEDISLRGFISKESHSQKDLQFVYVNKRLVLNSCIHKEINKIIGRSSIVRRKEQSSQMPDILPSTGSPSKQNDSCGIFLLNITCPFHFYDITFDPKKTLVEFSNYAKLRALLQDMVYGLLRKENLLSVEPYLPSLEIEQRDSSNDVVKTTTDFLQIGKPNYGANISAIHHSDIIFSKPVKQCNTNYKFESYDLQTENCTNESLEAEQNESISMSEIPQLEVAQPTALECLADSDQEEVFIGNKDKQEKSDARYISRANEKDTGTVAILSSRSQDIFNKNSSKESETLTINEKHPKHCKKLFGLNVETPLEIGTKKPCLSKIAVDKSVKYTSTLGCLREFQHTARKEKSVKYTSTLSCLRQFQNTVKSNVSTCDSEISINTLTELKRATKSSKNSDIVLKTPHTTTKDTKEDNCGSNSSRQGSHVHQTGVSILNADNDELLSHMDKSLPRKSFSGTHKMHSEGIKDTPIEADNSITLDRSYTMENDKTDSDCSNETFSSLTRYRNGASRSEDNELPCDLPKKFFVSQKNSLVALNEPGISNVSKAACNIASTSNKFGIESKLRSSKHSFAECNKMHPYLRIAADNPRDVRTSNLYMPSSSHVFVSESNPRQNCESQLKTPTDNQDIYCDSSKVPSIFNQRNLAGHTVTQSISRCLHKEKCDSFGDEVRDTVSSDMHRETSGRFGNEKHCSFDTVLSDHHSSTYSVVPSHHTHKPPKEHLGLASGSEDLEKAYELNRPVVNELKEIEENVGSHQISPESIRQDTAFKATINVESSIKDSKEVQPMESQQLVAKEKILIIENDKQLGLNVSLNFNRKPKLSSICNRKRKSVCDFELSSNVSTSKKSHYRCLEQESDLKKMSISLSTRNHTHKTYPGLPHSILTFPGPIKSQQIMLLKLCVLNNNFISNTILLKQTLEQFTNQIGSGFHDESITLPALTSVDQSRPASAKLHVFDSSERASCSNDTSTPSIKAVPDSNTDSIYNSIRSKFFSKHDGNVEMIEDDEQTQIISTTDSPKHNETISDLLCCEGKQSLSIKSCYNHFSMYKNDPQSNQHIQLDDNFPRGYFFRRQIDQDTLKNPSSGEEINRTSGDSYSELTLKEMSSEGLADLKSSSTFDLERETDSSCTEEGAVSIWDANKPSALEVTQWKNPVFKKHKLPCLSTQLCPSLANIAKTCFSLINGLEFTGAMLQNATVLGQIENKFIACMIEKANSKSDADTKEPLLVLFDQHAVHERIRLETLTNNAEEANGNAMHKRLKRAQVNPPVTLPIGKDDARLVKAFHTEFQRIGVDYRLDESTQNMPAIMIQSLPMCMVLRDVDGKQREDEYITRNAKDLIQEHIQQLKATSGFYGRMPLTVHRVLCSQACRGAIKFGDKVSLQTCKELINQLSDCNLPFQCAHGRPSIVPLINLTSLESHCGHVREKPKLRTISPHFSSRQENLMTQ